MQIETESAHVTHVGGNVFADLGFEPEEAAALQAESEYIIAKKLANKVPLSPELSDKASISPARRNV